MSQEDQQIDQALNEEDMPGGERRANQVLKRAAGQVALIDIVSLIFARLWSALAVIAAPLFALMARPDRPAGEQHRASTGETKR